MTEHPNQVGPQAKRAPRPNRVSYESSSPAFLSHEFSRASSRLTEGLSSKGFEREINGRQGEDKLLSPRVKGKISCRAAEICPETD
jgi:hypothetical protein